MVNLNKVWNTGKIPERWRVARIVPIYKGGGIEQTANYRGISLLDSGHKVLTNILAERLNSWLEEEKVFGESQAGFRRHRRTRDHLLLFTAFSEIIEL